MKKIILTIISILLFIPSVKAFDIDLNKLVINNYDEKLEELQYKIDASGYEQKIEYNKEIQNITKKLISISFSNKSEEEKLSEFTDYMYLDNNGFSNLSSFAFIKSYLSKISEKNITYDYIKIIRTSKTDNGVYSFAYIPNCQIDNEKKDIIVIFWLKKDNDEYKVFYPWITYEDELNEYFDEITLKENNGNNIGATFNKITTETTSIDNETLNNVYAKVSNSNIAITGLNAEKEIYGSGFFITKGAVVTTWSIAKQLIENNSFVYINDANGNSYNILGLIAVNTDYNVAVLKTENVGTPVSFTSPSTLKTNDNLFTINSKQNTTFSINYGKFLNVTNGKIEKLFVQNKSDVGSALYNENGQVVGFNTDELLNSDLSYGNSTDYLIKLQEILNNQRYEDITYTSLDNFKIKSELNIQEEKSIFNIPDHIWDNYKQIGKIEENIPLKIIKANYENNIISIRYKNNLQDTISNQYLLTNYIDELIEEGYEIKSNTYNKIVLKNNKYNIMIKSDMSYIVILIMEA